MRGTRIFVVALLALASLTAVAQPSAAQVEEGFGPDVTIRESVEQLSVTGLAPGATVEVLRTDGSGGDEVAAQAVADDFGSALFRDLEPGDGYGVRVGDAVERNLVVDSEESSLPDQPLYDSQQLEEGFQYIETRDGTQLSAYVVLPGPPEDGPYPTVVEYSGYDPSNPIAGIGGLAGDDVDVTEFCGVLPILCKAPAQPSSVLAGVMGYAVVGVNVRGTGCSGGAYDYFETMQVLDGYDVIETVAAQDWSTDRVGMVGLSYPGLAQLFVAQSQPPSLAAITPLSVYGDSGTGVLRPGGLLNTGFAVSWVDQVLSNAQPSGTSWVRQLIDQGDQVCEANQRLREQNVDVIAKAFDNPFYTEEVAAPLDIRRFAGDIDVPVFLASAWQDEQTGPSFADLLDDFESSPVTKFHLYNGLHADGFAPQILAEWKAFLDLYVADEIPSLPAVIDLVTPVFTEGVFGVPVTAPPLDRFDGVTTVEEARTLYEAEPDVRVIFESGAGDPDHPGAPVGSFEQTSDEWPHPDVAAQRWYFDADGELTSTAPTDDAAVMIQPDPSVVDTTFWSGGSGLWMGTPDYVWEVAPEGRRANFETAPLEETLTLLGTASVDLLVQSTSDDPALEVVVSEVRPDGQEMLVQAGLLRASYRTLEDDSTELHPVQLGREADVASLPEGEWEEMRILVPAFGHAFREGSRIRITVNTPGGDRARWSYAQLEVDADTETLIGAGGEAVSSVALPVLAGAEVPTPLPPCPSLRGQPCRATPAIDNVVVGDDDEPAEPTFPTPPDGPDVGGEQDERSTACGSDVPPSGFDDVGDDNVHAEQIRCLVSLGLLEGMVQDRFEPGEPMTRDQLASVLARTIEASGIDLPAGDDAFPDADPAHRERINQLAAAGLVLGRDDGTFGSGDPITRAQLASLLVRVFEFVVDDTLPAGDDAFPDDDGNVHEANIDKGAEAGFVDGYADGTFRPGAEARRDQIASVVGRVLDRLVADGVTLRPATG